MSSSWKGQSSSRAGAAHSIDELMSNFTNAIGHLSITNKSRRQLFDLPQEIQDIIIDYAFTASNNAKIVTKYEWERRELRQRRITGKCYQSRAFPSVKVNEFMVCKRFFLASARVFICSLSAHTVDQGHLSSTLGIGSCYEVGVINHFATKVRLDLLHMRALAMEGKLSPGLKSVTRVVKDSRLSKMILTIFATENLLSDEDLLQITQFFKLDHLAGLKEFKVEGGPFIGRSPDSSKLIWETNMRMLEDYIQQIVTKPKVKDDSIQNDDLTALYLGSSVGFSRDLMSTDSSDYQERVKLAKWRTAASGVTTQDLPNSVEGMMKLLEQDGDKVMQMIADLKSKQPTVLVSSE